MSSASASSAEAASCDPEPLAREVPREDRPEPLVVLDEQDVDLALDHGSIASTRMSRCCSSIVHRGTTRTPASSARRRGRLEHGVAEPEARDEDARGGAGGHHQDGLVDEAELAVQSAADGIVRRTGLLHAPSIRPGTKRERALAEVASA